MEWDFDRFIRLQFIKRVVLEQTKVRQISLHVNKVYHILLDLYHQLELTEHWSSVVASVGESVKRRVSLQLNRKQAHVETKPRAERDEKVSLLCSLKILISTPETAEKIILIIT